MKFSLIVLIAATFSLTGCFLPPKDSTRQKAVPELEIHALRYNDEGLHYVQGGRFVDGEFRFRKALHLLPKAEKIKVNLGVSLFMQEEYAQAKLIFRELFQGDPLNQSYRLWLAKTHVALKEFSFAEALLIDGQNDAEAIPDLIAASIFSRSLANLYVRTGETKNAFCSSYDAYNFSPTMEEGLEVINLLLKFGQATAADYFFKNILTAGGDGSSSYQLRRVETALLLRDLGSAKENIQSALHLNASDPIQVYDRRLLSTVVGLLLKKNGETVDLAVLEDDNEVQDLLEDPRAEQSPVYGIIQSLLVP